MSFISNSLSSKEEVCHTFDFHWLIWLQPISFVLISFLTLLIGAASGSDLLPLGISMTISAAIYSAYHYFDIKNSERGITNRRIVAKEGIFSTKTDELRLVEVESVNLQQNIFEKLSGAGKLVLSGTGNKLLIITFLKEPFVSKRQIEELIEQAKSSER
ncbi:MAG: PH domain-containing protein [Pseudomonadota bacterium]|nr:PH domain-containing protein [Pseudomonadota bacterium]